MSLPIPIGALALHCGSALLRRLLTLRRTPPYFVSWPFVRCTCVSSPHGVSSNTTQRQRSGVLTATQDLVLPQWKTSRAYTNTCTAAFMLFIFFFTNHSLYFSITHVHQQKNATYIDLLCKDLNSHVYLSLVIEFGCM